MIDSMVVSEIAEPYARALMSLAQEHQLTDKFGEDASFLLELLNTSDDLEPFLANPLVPVEAKKGVIQNLVGDNVHPYIQNFLGLLVDRTRIMFLGGILRQYQALLRELNQTALAEVVAAVELSDEQKERVKQKVREFTGAQQVELQVTLDPSLLGGLVIKVGSQVIDASLRGQLRRIGLQLSAAA